MIRTILKERFELTQQETQLVRRLLTGASLSASADALGIEYETARTHLKSVFSKTATNRQSQLVIVALRAVLVSSPGAKTLDDVLNPPCPNCGVRADLGYDPTTGECSAGCCE